MCRDLPVMSLALAAAALAGCRGGRVGSAAEVEWGPEKDGIATRLVPLEKEYVLGRPMRFRLEMTNRTLTELLYDSQQVAVNHSLVITGPDGKRAPYIRGTCQTSIRGQLSVTPGETVVLFGGLDANEQYFIGRSGRWTFQYAGRGLKVGEQRDFEMLFKRRDRVTDADARKASWLRLMCTEYPSNVLEIDMLPGEVPHWRVAAGRILDVLRRGGGWEVSWLRGGGKLTPEERELSVRTAISLRQTGRKGGAYIRIRETGRRLDPASLDRPWHRSPSEYWGERKKDGTPGIFPPMQPYRLRFTMSESCEAVDVGFGALSVTGDVRPHRPGIASTGDH